MEISRAGTGLLWLLAAWLLLFSTPAGAVPLADALAEMDVADRLHHYRTPGVSLAVFSARGLEWSGGFGQTTHGGAPVTGTTRFQAASVSKVVAALCTLRLAAEGRFTLEAPVNGLLRSWKLPNSFGSAIPPVRLRELLSHTGGVNVPGFPGYAHQAALPTLAQVLRGEPPAVTPPVAVTLYPGSVFRYSGGGSSVVQQLLEDVSERHYAALAETLVLRPATMPNSGYSQPRTLHNVALGHDAAGRKLPGGWRVYPELAAAGLWSTAEDLARLGRALCLAARGRHALLPLAWARSMFALQAREGTLGAGLGVFVKQGPQRVVFHEGANQGYKCLLLLLPERCEGLAVMTNAENGRGLAMELLQAVARARGWPGLGSPRGGEPSAREAARAAASYLGVWQDSHGGVLRIVRQGSGLGLQLFEGMVPAPLRVLPGEQPRLALDDPLTPELLRRDGAALVLERALFSDLRARRLR